MENILSIILVLTFFLILYGSSIFLIYTLKLGNDSGLYLLSRLRKLHIEGVVTVMGSLGICMFFYYGWNGMLSFIPDDWGGISEESGEWISARDSFSVTLSILTYLFLLSCTKGK